jgi:hypothetical protein
LFSFLSESWHSLSVPGWQRIIPYCGP